MKEIIQQARKRAGLTQEQAAKKMFMGLRQYQRLEYGEQEMTPEEVLRLSKILNCPQLTIVYCKKNCAIGRRYCYSILNNVDLNPTAILTKYRQEAKEAAEALDNLAELMLNKRDKNDCTEEELKQIWRWALEMLDEEHVIETFKMELWKFIDVAALIREHELKCLEKRYYDPRQPDLQLAG